MEIFSIIILFLIFLAIIWSFGSSKAYFIVTRLQNEILSNPKEIAIRIGENDIVTFGLILVGEYVFKGFSSEKEKSEAKKLEKAVNLINKAERFFLDEVVFGIEPKIALVHLQMFKGALLIRECENLFKDNDILLNKIKSEIIRIYRSKYEDFFITPYHRQHNYNPHNYNSNSGAEIYYQEMPHGYYGHIILNDRFNRYRFFNPFKFISSVDDYFRLFSQTYEKIPTSVANEKNSAHFYELVFWTTLQDITSNLSVETMKKESLEYGVFDCILMCIKEIFTAGCLPFINNNIKEHEHKNYTKETSISKVINSVKVPINKNNTTTPVPAPHSEPQPAPSIPPLPPELCIPDDTPAGKLVCVGLAHIGRKTALKNKYITDESEAERYSIERPFLDLLSAKFKDDTQRGILRDNFMFFKEACLLLIYRVLLKNNPDIKTKAITMLQTLLSQNRTQADNQSRKEYLELFSKRFSYAYQKTKSTGKSLRYAFWNILAANYPDWVNRESVADIMNNDYLLKIFRYSYDALMAACGELVTYKSENEVR